KQSLALPSNCPNAPDPFNLVLVEKSINASLGNRPYSKKRSVYSQSQLLLTKAFAEKPKVGTQTKIDKAVENIESFREWNEANLKRRHKQIGKLARTVWGIPRAS
ncbi:MAG: HNH endonuclease family protein, partial [Gammaproteobacteria bacterium]|nr:HNH endonuclease family protein [Gammaproteobacteria bacterium]